jgi:cyclophilin family peptidyl-prolyl cis-trans isomerase
MTKKKHHHPIVTIKTSLGDIKVELYEDKAPLTVKNFLDYVEIGYYAHTIFHRVIDGFMIQGGGFTKKMEQKPTHSPVLNEAHNGLTNKRGTLAMARTSDVNSATSQFFINVADNHFLDHKSKSPSGYGYCVFGHVIGGMEVIDQIKEVDTHSKGHHQDVPVEAIEILSVEKAK